MQDLELSYKATARARKSWWRTSRRGRNGELHGSVVGGNNRDSIYGARTHGSRFVIRASQGMAAYDHVSRVTLRRHGVSSPHLDLGTRGASVDRIPAAVHHIAHRTRAVDGHNEGLSR